METTEVHDYINAMGGSAFRPTALPRPITAVYHPPVNIQPNVYNRPYFRQPVIVTQPVLPVLPAVNQFGGGGGAAPTAPTNTPPPTNIVVVAPAQYFERKGRKVVAMSGQQNVYPTCILDTNKYFMMGGLKYVRVTKFIEPSGDFVDATIYSNGRHRRIFVTDFTVSEDQQPAYVNAGGDESAKPVEAKPETKTTEKVTVPFVAESEKGRFGGMAIGIAAGLAFSFGTKKGKTSHFLCPIIFGLVGFGAGYILDKKVLSKK